MLVNYHFLLFHVKENSRSSLRGIKRCVAQKLTYTQGCSGYSYIWYCGYEHKHVSWVYYIDSLGANPLTHLNAKTPIMHSRKLVKGSHLNSLNTGVI